MEHGFFSRKDNRSLDILNEIFTSKKRHLWLIEDIETKKWVTEDNDHLVTTDNWKTSRPKYITTQTTLDIEQAKQFQTQMQAQIYLNQNKLNENFISKEYVYIDDIKNIKLD